MQKKIIALAVAGLVSGGAMAQSNVTIFGLFDASLVQHNAKGTTYAVNSSAWGTTHIGFRGTENLGGGMQAFFNLRGNVNVMTGGMGSGASGATTAGYNDFNSWANIGLSGGFGTLMLGRQTTPVFATFGAVDAFQMASLGIGQQWGMANTTYFGPSFPRSPLTNLTTTLTTNTLGGATLASAYAGGISYTTPNLSGFQVKVFNTFGNAITGAPFQDNGLREISLSYNNGPISANYAHNDTTNRVTASAAGAFAANITEVKFDVMGLAYTVGGLRLAGSYFKAKYDVSLRASMHDNSAWSFGARYTKAPWTYGAEFTSGKDDITSTNKDTILGFMLNYDLSKRTSVYGLLGILNNSGEASMHAIWSAPNLVNTAGNSMDARGARATSVVTGIRHSF